MDTITRQRLTAELHALGVRAGDCVMLHSSLSSLGCVDGGAATVVESFLDAMGPDGTLLTPAFTQGAWTGQLAMPDCGGCGGPRPVCPSSWPSHEGAIPNAALQRPGRCRGCHPTHSWVANGARAGEAVRDQRHSATCCGRGTPFERLLEWDGCIVVLGVGVNTITLWHYYEDILEVPYRGHHHAAERHLSYCTAGRRIQYEFPGIMDDVVQAAGIMNRGALGRSRSGLIRARAFRRFMATIISNDPYCFILRPPDRHSGNLCVDALQKAASMLAAWDGAPLDEPRLPEWPPGRDNDVVREDCPAFAGYHDSGDRTWPLCRANDRHPELFGRGGAFNQWGPTTCGRCPWHWRYPA